jgi:hypothetical protein
MMYDDGQLLHGYTVLYPRRLPSLIYFGLLILTSVIYVRAQSARKLQKCSDWLLQACLENYRTDFHESEPAGSHGGE